MSKYIKLEGLKWHSPDESLAKPLTEFYVTESDIADLPTIDIVHCKDCKHRYVTGVTTQYYVCDFMDAEYSDDGYCYRGERKDNE